MRKINLIILTFLLANGLFFQGKLWADTITLKSGEILEVNIIEETDRYVKAEFQGIELKYYKDEIESIAKEKVPPPPPEVVKKVTYRVKKEFTLRPLMNLNTMQFKYPMTRMDIPHLNITNIVTNPKANALVDDPDGNKIAVFYFSSLRSGQAQKVVLSYDVEIEQLGITFKPEDLPGTYDESSTELRKFLLQEGEKEIDRKVQEKAEAILKGKETPYQKAKAIYDFIADTIKYENIERKSGSQKAYVTLFNKRGNCADIAKLYVSMARVAKIPVRQVDGVVFQPMDDSKKYVTESGHAWVEIFLPAIGWLPVDATFGISKKDQYFCFPYDIHIPECYGQLVSKDSGTLYRGHSVQVSMSSAPSRTPVDLKAKMEMERLPSRK